MTYKVGDILVNKTTVEFFKIVELDVENRVGKLGATIKSLKDKELYNVDYSRLKIEYKKVSKKEYNAYTDLCENLAHIIDRETYYSEEFMDNLFKDFTFLNEEILDSSFEDIYGAIYDAGFYEAIRLYHWLNDYLNAGDDTYSDWTDARSTAWELGNSFALIEYVLSDLLDNDENKN